MTSENVTPAADASADAAHGHTTAGFGSLILGSIGVVYGDIGTSPLYAFREAIIAAGGHNAPGVNNEAILGVLSLILWALIIVVHAQICRDPITR